MVSIVILKSYSRYLYVIYSDIEKLQLVFIVILKSYSRYLLGIYSDIEKLQSVTREPGSLGRHAEAGECQMPGINRLDTYPLFIFTDQGGCISDFFILKV